MNKLTTIVAGFGRCGSSLVMRMLARAGIQCAFDHEISMELGAAGVGVAGDSWFAQCEGRAVKVLDPHRKDWPWGKKLRWIWIDRDPTQQAKSQLKLLRTVGMRVNTDPKTVAKLARSMVDDRATCIKVMGSLGGDILALRFENVINSPAVETRALLEFVGSTADANTVSREIIKRSTDCLPNMLELSQLPPLTGV